MNILTARNEFVTVYEKTRHVGLLAKIAITIAKIKYINSTTLKSSTYVQNPRRCHNTKVIASTHAQMHPRNNTRARVVELISYTRPRPAPLGAGRGREYEGMSSRACHTKHHA